MRNYNKKIVDGTWITFPEDKEVQIKIKPFSLFSMIKDPNNESYNAETFWAIFNHIVLDWKGVQSDGKKLECNEENKKFVFDYDQPIALFVINESSAMRTQIISEKELKN